NSLQPIIIYSTSEYNQLPSYLLTTSTIPSNSGQVVPASQYYKAGSKVLITAENTSSYGFIKWYGVGNENYTGTDMAATVVMNSNVSEFAYFEPKYPVNFKSNIPATPFTLNGNPYTTNLKINLTSSDAYTYDFSPAFYSPNKNAYYTLTSIDFCGKTTSSNPNTFIMSEEMNNCTIEATYSIDYLVTFTVYNGSISLSPLGICTGSATSTESCYYPAGTTVTMTDTANSGYAFHNYTGTGNGSYSGTNNPATITVNGPITEIANTYAIIYVYVKSSQPISFSINNQAYTTNATVLIERNKPFTITSNGNSIPGEVYENWGTRSYYGINSQTTCKTNGSTFYGENTSSPSQDSCTIFINQSNLQYALVFITTNNGANQTTSFQYGNVYFANGTEANQTNWINAGTNVSFYATNTKVGYAFQGFTSPSGQINGAIVEQGYTGPDSVPGTLATSGTYTIDYSSPPPRTTYSNSIGWDSYFGNVASSGLNSFSYLPPLSQEVYNEAKITINSPVIEFANYIPTQQITTAGTHSITIPVTYMSLYYTSWCGNLGCDIYSNKQVYQKSNITYTYTVDSPFTNYSAGLGTLNLYYGLWVSYEYISNWYASTGQDVTYYRYAIANMTEPNTNNMPSEYETIINNIISYINSKYPTGTAGFPIYSFTFAGINVYVNYPLVTYYDNGYVYSNINWYSSYYPYYYQDSYHWEAYLSFSFQSTASYYII
ncbi:MAG: hypothetical protein QXU98_11395, partial [Candidatus Parvarchaeota archaeon]